MNRERIKNELKNKIWEALKWNQYKLTSM
jgi:hypothetical protein